jgi:hypothetical protein
MVLALALALAAPGAALAQAPEPVHLDGSPLDIFTSAGGSIQAAVDGYGTGEFYSPRSSDPEGNPIPNPDPNFGFGVGVFDGQGGMDYYSRFASSAGPLPNPEGPFLAPGDPATLTTNWTIPDAQGAPLLRVTQVLAYSNGSREFDATWTIDNVGSAPVNFRAGVGGDFAIRGSDSGIGFLTPGPPRFVGGVNPNVGAAGGFVEDTPWSAWQVSQYSDVGSNLRGTGLNNQIVTTIVDNGAAVQWSNFEPPNAPLSPTDPPAVFSTGMRFIETLGLDPVTQTKQTGEEAVVNATLGDVNGNPAADQPLRWQVSGPNFASGAVTTNDQGRARIGWIGGQPGEDQLTVYNDANGNESPDFDETQASATVTWEGPSGPILGQSVNVRETAGNVRVQLPKGSTAARAKALGLPPAAAERFIPLTAARSIPLGSTLDTRRGTVNLLSAAGRQNANNSAYNGANFRGGTFRIGQKGSGLTELSMKGGGLGACETRVPRGGAKKVWVHAARRSRKLFGSGRGRFRTRGRNSSATVRGTKWLQKDTCKGTLTTVQRGSVVVRDFAKGKKVVLKKGGKRTRYLARAPKRRR